MKAYRELMKDWIVALDAIHSKMEVIILATPMPSDVDSEEEFKDDLRSAMLTLDDAIYELKEVAEKLEG
jgi:hypothetical protein